MSSFSDSLEGRTAIVTGACGGIGRATCERLAAEGVRIVLVDIEEESAQAFAASLGTEVYVAAVDAGACAPFRCARMASHTRCSSF